MYDRVSPRVKSFTGAIGSLSDARWTWKGKNDVRVAFCITELEAGGAERALAELAVRIDRDRFAPHVYCLAPPPLPGLPSVVPRLQEAGVPIDYLNASWRLAWPRVVRDLAALWRRDQPELVQTFLFHANIVGRCAAMRARIPHVVAGVRVAERRRRTYLWVERLTARMVDRHVCVSQAVAEFTRTQGGIPADRLIVIPNGIDLARFSGVAPVDLTQFGVPADRKCVVCIGRLDEQKRPDWLVRHSPTWMAALPKHDLLLVGDGPRRANVMALAHQLGIGHRVHLAGWRPDVPSILAACDLLVLASRWEGMPNVVLEAMASGLPVVATSVEGVAELLGQNSAMQSAAVDDGASLANQIVAILYNPLCAQELGRANRARVEAEFDVKKSIRAYEALYEQLAHE
jgi:glycosyltransferase involved in cell wall biosynthesis